MSAEQKYCVATTDLDEEGRWYACCGLSALRQNAHEYTGVEVQNLPAAKRIVPMVIVYRAEDVLADALGIAYVRPGAEPVTLNEVRESDAVAGRIFDAANGSVTDAAGKIATVPNTQLPAPSTEGN